MQRVTRLESEGRADDVERAERPHPHRLNECLEFASNQPRSSSPDEAIALSSVVEMPTSPSKLPHPSRRLPVRPGCFLIGFIVLVLSFSSRLVAAQEPHAYAGGAFMFSMQGAAPPRDGPDSPKPGVGGSAVGIVGSVGVFVSARVSLSAEFSLPERFDAVQELNYSFSARYDNRHRDVIVSGMFHVHDRSSRSLRPEFVAGVSYVREDTRQRSAYQLGPAFPPTGVYGPYGPAASTVRETLAATAGADLDIPLEAHVGVVPQGRIYWIAREDRTSGSLNSSLFLSPFVYRLAIGLRATF
jgi:hypothetical protein